MKMFIRRKNGKIEIHKEGDIPKHRKDGLARYGNFDEVLKNGIEFIESVAQKGNGSEIRGTIECVIADLNGSGFAVMGKVLKGG